MRLFTSDRERGLWIWTLAVVVAIYSTLGLARTLADELRSRQLFDGLFLLGLLLIGAAVVALALWTRPGRVEIGVALGVAAVYMMVFLRMAIPEERTHLIEYSVVALFIYEALSERARNGRSVGAPALFAVLIAGLVGVIDECIQAVLPSRVFDPIDILFNILAAIMAVITSVALRWARRRSNTWRQTLH